MHPREIEAQKNFEHVEVGWRQDIGFYKKFKDGMILVKFDGNHEDGSVEPVWLPIKENA